MRDKKIEVDATLREIPAYTLGEVPIFRWEHRLDDFQTCLLYTSPSPRDA